MDTQSLSEYSTHIVESNISQNVAEPDVVDHDAITSQQQIAKLNKVVGNLESAIQMKNAQFENVYQEKTRLLAELKKQQRYNRNLKQQLDDERLFYQRERDRFAEEMQRYRIRCTGSVSKFQQQWRKELERARSTLETENKQLREELADKSKVTYNLCIKFLRMKHAKDTLRHKLDQLMHEHLLVMAEMMDKLDEARKELNLIVSEKFLESLPLSKAKFLQVVQRNNRLAYENATLKVQVYQLTQNIEKLKSQAQRPKKINVDAKIIEKLSQCSTRSPPDKTGKVELLSKLSSVDHSGDGKTRAHPEDDSTDNYTTDNDVKDSETNSHSETNSEEPSCIERAREIADTVYRENR